MPADVTVTVGDSVTWRNTDTVAHQVVFDRAPCNLTIQPGASASCTFRSGGKFNYRDPSQQGNFRGTVTVSTTSVTISSSRQRAPFAAAVTLSGIVSSQQAGEPVTVLGQECGKTTFTRVAAATTTAGGNWTFVVNPKINTVYQARWRTTDSAMVTVKVLPRLRLSRVGSRFNVRLTAAEPFSGKFVVFQRYRVAVGRWVTIKRVTLGTATTPTPGTVVTAPTFRNRVRRGWRLRVLLTQTQAGSCYLAAPSNVLRVR